MRRRSDDGGQPDRLGLRDLNPGYFALVMATALGAGHRRGKWRKIGAPY